MPSLIPGFQYDIFLSNRHKDNKYEGWVTEFVVNLQKEPEATFKEDIYIISLPDRQVGTPTPTMACSKPTT